MGKLFEKFGAAEREKLLKSAEEVEKPSTIELPDELLDAVSGGDRYETTNTPCPDCGTNLIYYSQLSLTPAWALFCPSCGGTAKDGWWNYQ